MNGMDKMSSDDDVRWPGWPLLFCKPVDEVFMSQAWKNGILKPI